MNECQTTSRIKIGRDVNVNKTPRHSVTQYISSEQIRNIKNDLYNLNINLHSFLKKTGCMAELLRA